jgi:hypothetical protein
MASGGENAMINVLDTHAKHEKTLDAVGSLSAESTSAALLEPCHCDAPWVLGTAPQPVNSWEEEEEEDDDFADDEDDDFDDDEDFDDDFFDDDDEEVEEEFEEEE